MRTFTAQILRRDQLRSDTPLASAVESFFRSCYDLSDKSREFYRTHFNGYMRFVWEQMGTADPAIKDLCREYVDAYLERLSKSPTKKYPKGSPFRARAAAVSLKRLANWLAQDGIHSDVHGGSVLKPVRKPKLPEDVRQPLTLDELDQVAMSAGKPGERDYALITFAAATGLRFNELRMALVGDLDFRAGLHTVRAEVSKVDRSRTVDVHDAVLREVDRYLRSRPGLTPDSPLFPTDEGEQFEPDGLDKVFRRIRKRSGLRRFHVHLLRHTWATNFNGDLLELKRQGGWKEWKQVERYRHGQRPDRKSLFNPLDTGRRKMLAFRKFRASADV
jgi:integrase